MTYYRTSFFQLLTTVLFSAIARANKWAPEWEEIMPGHRSFLRIGDICYSLVNVQLTITLSEDINPINSKDYHCDFLKRYNYYPKLEKAWTFGEKDDVPLRRVFK